MSITVVIVCLLAGPVFFSSACRRAHDEPAGAGASPFGSWAPQLLQRREVRDASALADPAAADGLWGVQREAGGGVRERSVKDDRAPE
jgi:hypothetical protein